jgi:SagB-type dehydrogenase family enzyme
VSYWVGGGLVFENYLTRTRVSATPRACEILHVLEQWRPAAALAGHFPDDSADDLARALLDLTRAGLVEYSRTPRRRDDALASWAAWSPAASYFHFSTKDAHAPIAPEDSVRTLRERARATPMPPPVKRSSRRGAIALPAPRTDGDVARALLARRTWRRFSGRPVQRDELATLLGLTFGVQWWFDLDGVGRTALKTSPSGGSRHPIEAYVVALRVKGLRRGLYHYDAGGHRLEPLRRGATPAQVARYLNGQTWCGKCAALVLMTGVFARTRWKYPAPRAYRVVLIEAGHVCQTFCLVATWLGLAPFCTMALADSAIEHDLKIDGVNESILYTAGVGRLPAATDWAPWHSTANGRRVPNHAMRVKRPLA